MQAVDVTVIDNSRLTLPKITGEQYRAVPSPSSQRGLIYSINFESYTCTCQDFSEHRAGFPSRDLRRLCRHMAREMPASLLAQIPIEVATIIDAAPVARLYERAQCYRFENDPFVVTWREGSWVDVFARGHEGYSRFGYELSQSRWSYGKQPVIAGVIAATIRQHFFPTH